MCTVQGCPSRASCRGTEPHPGRRLTQQNSLKQTTTRTHPETQLAHTLETTCAHLQKQLAHTLSLLNDCLPFGGVPIGGVPIGGVPIQLGHPFNPGLWVAVHMSP